MEFWSNELSVIQVGIGLKFFAFVSYILNSPPPYIQISFPCMQEIAMNWSNLTESFFSRVFESYSRIVHPHTDHRLSSLSIYNLMVYKSIGSYRFTSWQKASFSSSNNTKLFTKFKNSFPLLFSTNWVPFLLASFIILTWWKLSCSV